MIMSRRSPLLPDIEVNDTPKPAIKYRLSKKNLNFTDRIKGL